MKTVFFVIGILFFSLCSNNANAQFLIKTSKVTKATLISQMKAKATYQKLVNFVKAENRKRAKAQSSRVLRKPAFSKIRPTHRGTAPVVATTKKAKANVSCVNGCLDVIAGSGGSGYNSSVAICIDLCTCLEENPGNVFKCARQASKQLTKQ